MKWGLAGCGRIRDWPSLLASRHAWLFGSLDNAPHTALPACVFVAYADWQCAQSPPLDAVADQACRTPGSVLLVDTCCKTPAAMTPSRRPTLLDWTSVEEAIDLVRRCREAKVCVALAGSLGISEICLLRSARPTWFAVRGAGVRGRQARWRSGRVPGSRTRTAARRVKAPFGRFFTAAFAERFFQKILFPLLPRANRSLQ